MLYKVLLIFDKKDLFLEIKVTIFSIHFIN